MAAGDLLTGAFQIELRSILMEANNTHAGLIVQDWFDGLGVPPTRNDDKLRPQQHGAFASPQYLGERVLTWTVVPRGTSPSTTLDRIEDLGTAMSPVLDTDTDLVIELAFTLADGGQKYLCYGKPGRAAFGYRNYLRTYDRGQGTLADAAVCEFICTDPRIYDATLQTTSTGLGSSTGGWDVGGWSFPFGFGTSTPGTAAVTNAGNIRTYPTILITAGGSGLSGIVITNNATGEQWSINITLAAADTLTIDMLNHTVLLNGSATRASLVNRPPSVWFGLDPGNTSVSWTGTGAGSTMAVSVRSAWLL